MTKEQAKKLLEDFITSKIPTREEVNAFAKENGLLVEHLDVGLNIRAIVGIRKDEDTTSEKSDREAFMDEFNKQLAEAFFQTLLGCDLDCDNCKKEDEEESICH